MHLVKKLPKYAREYDAIRRAKEIARFPQGEPRVGSEWVRLRELSYALDDLWSGASDPYEQVHKALKSGEITAFALSSGDQIPPSSWPEKYSEESTGFWTGLIIFDHDCIGFEGQLPVVEWRKAEKWLFEKSPTRPSGRPRKIDRAKEAYTKIYPKGHKVAGDVLITVLRKIADDIGENVSETTVKKAIRELSGQKP